MFNVCSFHVLLTAAAFSFVAVAPVGATATVYHDRTAFNLALAATPGLAAPQAEGFEAYALGAIAPAAQRGGFRYGFDSTLVQPAVVPDGGSGQALGGSPFDVFVGGDGLTLQWAGGSGLRAFGADFLYGPSGPAIPAGTYELLLPDLGLAVGNESGLDLDGGRFFLGVMVDGTDNFTQVVLHSLQLDPDFLVPAWLVDDLAYAAAVPAPGTGSAALGGLLCLGALRQKRRRRVAHAASAAVLLVVAQGAAAQVGSTPVRIVNPATNPVPMRDVDDPASRPFNKSLCQSFTPAALCNNVTPALPASFVVPTATASGEPVKRLVIEQVSGTCIGTGRTESIWLQGTPPVLQANPDTGDNFILAVFPMAPSQYLGGGGTNGVQAFGQTTRLYFDPGATVSFTYNYVVGGLLNCRVRLSGYLAV